MPAHKYLVGRVAASSARFGVRAQRVRVAGNRRRINPNHSLLCCLAILDSFLFAVSVDMTTGLSLITITAFVALIDNL